MDLARDIIALIPLCGREFEWITDNCVAIPGSWLRLLLYRCVSFLCGCRSGHGALSMGRRACGLSCLVLGVRLFSDVRF